jgi:dihydrolipoamide dehydrogenase
MSVGRKPAVQDIGLENIGVEIERGAVKTDDRGKTNVPEVYAAGDVNGRYMLAHTAYREAEVCVNNMLGKRDIVRYHAIPSVIYTNPEVASVGETEESARQKGIEFEVAKVSMRYSGRYVAENEGGDGICKVLINKKYRNVIGVHMIGNYSSEIIYGAGLMIEAEMRVKDIKELVFPHPTVSEVIRECIFQFED